MIVVMRPLVIVAKQMEVNMQIGPFHNINVDSSDFNPFNQVDSSNFNPLMSQIDSPLVSAPSQFIAILSQSPKIRNLFTDVVKKEGFNEWDIKKISFFQVTQTEDKDTLQKQRMKNQKQIDQAIESGELMIEAELPNDKTISKTSPVTFDRMKLATRIDEVDEDGNLLHTINIADMNVHAFTSKDLQLLSNLMLMIFAAEQTKKELKKLQEKLESEIRESWKQLENKQNERSEKYLENHHKEAEEKFVEKVNQIRKNLLLFIKSQRKEKVDGINLISDEKITITSKSIKNLQHLHSEI